MRIGFDALSLMRLPRCGMHHHTYEIIRALIEQYPEDEYFLFFDEGLRNDPLLDRRFLDALGGKLQSVPLRTVGPTFVTAQMAWYRWHLPRAIARTRLDIFHGFSHALPFTRQCPTVVTVHDLMPEAMLSWRPDDSQARFRRRQLVSAVRRAQGICAVSDATRRDILLIDPTSARKPVCVVPNAVRDTLGRVMSGEDLRSVAVRYRLPLRFFLTVGADTPRRNFANLIRAMATVVGRDPAAPSLLVVGASTWAETRVYATAKELGIDSKVVFLSGVSDSDLSAMYTLAEAYVCPSVHEGFAMPVLEAFACGARVLCSDLAVLRELAAGDAHYFQPEDPGSIAGALRSAAEEPPLSDESRHNLMAKSRRLSWAASARQVHGLYEALTMPALSPMGARGRSELAQ